MSDKIAVVSGASAGVGEATARVLAREGFRVLLGARRIERIAALAAELGGWAFPLDLRDEAGVEEFVAQARAVAPAVHVLVNNAAVAVGADRIEDASGEAWRAAWETNVLGLVLMTRGFIPLLRASGDGSIVNVGSMAGNTNYRGGAAYASTKHALRSITETLRLELNGEPIRVCEIAPGIIHTEFSYNRFKDEAARIPKIYEGMTPLSGADVAECIGFVATRPARVNVDYLRVQPLAQASQYMVNRESKV